MKQLTTKGATLILIIILISLLILVIIPVRSYSSISTKLSINIEPARKDDYYVYFPLFLSGDYQEFLEQIIITGNGYVEMIETEFGMTLNLSGNGPLSANIDNTVLEDFSTKFDKLPKDTYPIFLYNSLNMRNLSVKFDYRVHTFGHYTNIYGITFDWVGAGINRCGEDTLTEDGWQNIQTSRC